MDALENVSKHLLIIRGIPGSGKSTLAKFFANTQGYRHFETDMYFTDPKTGIYKYVEEDSSFAHDVCFNSTERALKEHGKVVVSNTFTRLWEFRNYIDLAISLRIPYTVIICNGNYESKHNVPLSKINAMRDRFEL